MDRSGEIHWAFDRNANAPKATDKCIRIITEYARIPYYSAIVEL